MQHSSFSRFGFTRTLILAGIAAAGSLGSSPLQAGGGEAFEPTVESARKPAGLAPAGMVWIPGGEFSMGSRGIDHGKTCCSSGTIADALPIHRVHVDGFWMDETDVTNRQFAEFVRATGYITVAERVPSKDEFPDVPEENLPAGSLVFMPTKGPFSLGDYHQWWSYVKGANWRHPTGPTSSIKGHGHDPVVQVAYVDAVAYAKWAKKRLPTEAEWEFAQRGGLSGKPYAWGDEFKPRGKHMANTYQGIFPMKDTGEDGFAGISPVKSFPPNGYGLYDMAGNVWQWCGDWYRPDTYGRDAKNTVTLNPVGPASGYDPAEPGVAKRVQRGGSFLCSDQYCARYVAGTRGKGEPETGSNHVGFRCVMTPQN